MKDGVVRAAIFSLTCVLIAVFVACAEEAPQQPPPASEIPAWVLQASAGLVVGILLTLLGIYRFRGIDERIDKIRDSMDHKFSALDLEVRGTIHRVNDLMPTLQTRIEEAVQQATKRTDAKGKDILESLQQQLRDIQDQFLRQAEGTLEKLQQQVGEYRELASDISANVELLKASPDSSGTPVTVEDAERMATAASSRGKRSEAAAILRRILDDELDGSPEAFHNAGAQASYIHERTLARDIFDVGRKKHPGFIDLHADYASICAQLGQREEARKSFESLKEAPHAQRNERFWVFYGSFLNRCREFEQAEKILSEAQSQLPNSGEVLRELAAARIGQNDLKGAEDLFKKAIEVQPSEHLAHSKYADFLWDRGRPEDNKKEVLEAIKYCAPSQGNYGTYHYELGRVCLALCQYKEAKIALELCLSLAAELAEAHILLGKLRFMQPDLFEKSAQET